MNLTGLLLAALFVVLSAVHAVAGGPEASPMRIIAGSPASVGILEQLATDGRIRLIQPDPGADVWFQLAKDNADAVAIDVLSALERISRDGSLSMFSSLGRFPEAAEADNGGKNGAQRVVLVARRDRLIRERAFFNGFVEELIKNHCLLGRTPESDSAVGGVKARLVSDPDPDYDGLSRLWKSRGLARPGQPRDYLSSHVNEEYFCDALYYLAERSPQDEQLRELLARAVCVPNCCAVYGTLRTTATK